MYQQLPASRSPFCLSGNRIILILGALLQVVFCLTQVGFYHPDQHFQLIEFSSYQLGKPNGASSVWELASQIRPTLQVFLFSAFTKCCDLIHLTDPYAQMSLLRLLFGLSGWAVFNALAIHYFRADRRVLPIVLLLLNFGWTLPYLRTLYSSEMASPIAFFGAILLYERTKQHKNPVGPLLTGLLMSAAFYLRFQMAFAIAGFGIWFLLFDKQYRHMLPLLAGFSLGIGLNCYLDYRFYHRWLFTPYRYYFENIAAGRAATFGTSSFLRYLLMLAMVIGTPPLSIFLFYYALKSLVKQYRQPLVIAVFLFVVGHCLVGHKEERFMFPVLNVLPLVAGFSLNSFIAYYQSRKPGTQRALKAVIGFSMALNLLVLALLPFNPYSQSVEFTRKLKNRFGTEPVTLYCINRTPWQTPSKLPLVYYRNAVPQIEPRRIASADTVRHLHHAWIVTTFNQVQDSLPFLDSLGLKQVLYSSPTLWQINSFLKGHKKHPINDIWVLYRKE